MFVFRCPGRPTRSCPTHDFTGAHGGKHTSPVGKWCLLLAPWGRINLIRPPFNNFEPEVVVCLLLLQCHPLSFVFGAMAHKEILVRISVGEVPSGPGGVHGVLWNLVMKGLEEFWED